MRLFYAALGGVLCFMDTAAETWHRHGRQKAVHKRKQGDELYHRHGLARGFTPLKLAERVDVFPRCGSSSRPVAWRNLPATNSRCHPSCRGVIVLGPPLSG